MGYAKLSSFLSSRPDTCAFKKFASLNAESILHMQAELLGLGMTLDEIREDPDLNAFDTSWLASPSYSSHAATNDLLQRVRILLRQYCKRCRRLMST